MGAAERQSYSRIAHDDGSDTTSCSTAQLQDSELLVGWDYDSRNRALFADRGHAPRSASRTRCRAATSSTTSRATDFLKYIPLCGRWLAFDATQLGYGEAIGDTTAHAAVPAVLRAAARIRCVAIARAASGPKDDFGNPYGGNMKVVSRTELIVPMPAEVRAAAPV